MSNLPFLILPVILWLIVNIYMTAISTKLICNSMNYLFASLVHARLNIKDTAGKSNAGVSMNGSAVER